MTQHPEFGACRAKAGAGYSSIALLAIGASSGFFMRDGSFFSSPRSRCRSCSVEPEEIRLLMLGSAIKRTVRTVENWRDILIYGFGSAPAARYLQEGKWDPSITDSGDNLNRCERGGNRADRLHSTNYFAVESAIRKSGFLLPTWRDSWTATFTARPGGKCTDGFA